MEETGHVPPFGEETRAPFAAGLVTAISTALNEDWKGSKGAAAAAFAIENYGLKKQCNGILDRVKDRTRI